MNEMLESISDSVSAGDCYAGEPPHKPDDFERDSNRCPERSPDGARSPVGEASHGTRRYGQCRRSHVHPGLLRRGRVGPKPSGGR